MEARHENDELSRRDQSSQTITLPLVQTFCPSSPHVRVHRIDNNHFTDPVTTILNRKWFKGSAQAKQFQLNLQRQFQKKRIWLQEHPKIVEQVAKTYDDCMSTRRNKLIRGRWENLHRLYVMMERGWVTEKETNSLFDAELLEDTNECDTEPWEVELFKDMKRLDKCTAKPQLGASETGDKEKRALVSRSGEKYKARKILKNSCPVSISTLEESLFRVALGSHEILLSQFILAVQDAFTRCRSNMKLYTVYGLRKDYGPLKCVRDLFKSFVACTNLLFGCKIFEFDFRSSVMDTRTLVLALRFLKFPLKSTKELLREGFLLHSQSPSFDRKRVTELKRVSREAQEMRREAPFRLVLEIVCLTSSDYSQIQDIKHRAVQVWKKIMNPVARLRGLLPLQQFLEEYVPHSSFQGLFATFESIEDHITEVSHLNVSTLAEAFITSEWEKLLPSRIQQYIAKERKIADKKQKVSSFILRWVRRKQHRSFQRWNSNTLLRKRARAILEDLVDRKWFHSLQDAFQNFMQNALREICVVKVQCLYRRHLVYRSIRNHNRQHHGAAAFQSMFRSWKARQEYYYLCDTRLSSAIVIQRLRRAVVSRRKFRKLFISLIAQERQRLLKEELRRREERKMESILLIQNAWRRRLAVLEKNKLLYAAWKVEHMAKMERVRQEEAYQRKLSRQAARVHAYYEAMEKERAAQERDETDNKVRIEIRRRRRCRAVQKWQNKLKETIQEEENAASKQLYAFNMSWNKKIEAELKRFRKYMQTVVLSDNSVPSSEQFEGMTVVPEEAKQSALETFKAIKKKARREDEYFDDALGYMRANDMVTMTYVEIWEKVLIRQQNEARKELEQEISRKRNVAKISREKFVQHSKTVLVLKLQNLWRAHVARQQFMYVAKQYIHKRIDGASLRDFYVNTKTKNSFWKKPAFWKENDVPYMDEWVECSDEEGDVYYLNPLYKRIQYPTTTAT